MTNVVELTPEMEEHDDGMWPAISLLLKRMETHPEEFDAPRRGFAPSTGKWTGILTELAELATPEDFAPIKAKLYELRMEGLYGKVVENLCRDAEDETIQSRYDAQLAKTQLLTDQLNSLQQLQSLQKALKMRAVQKMMVSWTLSSKK